MLTVISGNNRNGYPCALNKVGDIFQRGIPPFETEGLTDLWDASQKGGFLLAGPLSLIFSSTKVTASEESKPYAGVTVSMTSEDSAGYGNLSSHESGGAKYRQHRNPMPEVTVTSRNAINELVSVHLERLCADNLLNINAESTFVQAEGKEKGPAVSPALLSTLIISSPRNSQGLEHNSHLQATGNLSYSRNQHLKKTGAGFESPNVLMATPDAPASFLLSQPSHISMVGWLGLLSGRPVSISAGNVNSIQSTAYEIDVSCGGCIPKLMEATTMATTQTRPEFIDTYWIIPEYEATPYGKVSFTRQDRRTFIALFKDSRLIWAGRQPVKDLTENVICTQLQKLPVEGIAEGIEEISIPQGMVKITPPSSITNIVTVQGVAHV